LRAQVWFQSQDSFSTTHIHPTKVGDKKWVQTGCHIDKSSSGYNPLHNFRLNFNSENRVPKEEEENQLSKKG